jgi:CDP-glycerol glycerophosphotransferase
MDEGTPVRSSGVGVRGLAMGVHRFLKKWLFFYRPWTVFWAFYFGPWTWSFRFLNILIPKNPRLVMFGSNEGRLYSDNSRALFEHIARESDILKPIWITRSKDIVNEVEAKFPGMAVKSPSLKAAAIYLRAKQVVFCHSFLDMCYMPRIPGKFENCLWHSIPLKKIGFFRPPSKHRERTFTRWCSGVNRIFVASEYEEKMMRVAFGEDGVDFVISGNPRNDWLYDNSKAASEGFGNTRTILYAPTYRIAGDDGAVPNHHILHPSLSEKDIHEFLIENDAQLIVRPHWIRGEVGFASERMESVPQTTEPDLYRLFEKVDVFVTDYSGGFFDWLILDKPVVFSAYDLDEYEEQVGFVQDYSEFASGPICKTSTEVLEAIKEGLEEPEKFSDLRRAQASRFLGDSAGGASGRIMKILEDEASFGM